MTKELHLQKLIFLDENILNPNCDRCGAELSGFLITEEELLKFSPVDLCWLLQKNYIQKSKQYSPKLIIFLCKKCCEGEFND